MYGQMHTAIGDVGGLLTFAGGMPLLPAGIGVLILGVAVLLVIGHRPICADSPVPRLVTPFVTAIVTPLVASPGAPRAARSAASAG